jgi:DNA-binding transcriptional regulator YiaG
MKKVLDNTGTLAYIPPQVDGTQLRIIRREHGLTQEQLAQMLDVPRTTVCKWETGVYRMTRRDAIAVVHVINDWKERSRRSRTA